MRVIQKRENKRTAHLKIAENNPNIQRKVILIKVNQRRAQNNKGKAPMKTLKRKLKTNERARNLKIEV